MKYLFSFLLLAGCFATSYAQEVFNHDDAKQKGKIYAYWGWNRGGYTQSNISFRGDGYDFALENVIAKDKPTDFSFDTYFRPVSFTIPQYNFRVGYFISDHYDISFGIDHMKYVVQADQTVKINGTITGTDTPYDGNYDNDDIVVAPDFLQFEHTDGLNYINFEFRRFDEILNFNKLRINLTEGLGVGFLLPKTNAILLNGTRHDDFNLAGYGVNAVVGLNFTFFDHFFLQTELKGGFIDMPNMRTTPDKVDRASQNFFFAQWNFVFGLTFNTKKK
jgi:hypothetical protein